MQSSSYTLLPLTAQADRTAFEDALQHAGLPALGDINCAAYKFVGANGVVAYAALEGLASDALLRSVVVLPSHRGNGIGASLIAAIIAEAKNHGVIKLWLLTTAAERFFAQIGFMKTDRAAAPASIATTAEFASICPSSAVCMSRSIE